MSPESSSREGPEGTEDFADFPAAVFCIVCGRTDCAGCTPSERPRKRTPWEEAGLPIWKRLWQTARLATVEGETFFGGLDEGSVSSALGFAVFCEMLAIASLACAWIPVVYAVIPGFVEDLLSDQEQRRFAFAAVGLGVPTLALLMVVLHVLWAGGLELGLRLSGAPARLTHCLRYALYSCGWDLVTSPFGFAAGCASSGVSGATKELRAAVRIPRFATVAYIGRARAVPEANARRALAIAAVITGTVVLLGAMGLGVLLVMAMM